MSRFVLLAGLVLFLLFFVGAFGAENVTELRVETLTSPIRAGERVDFTFSAGNMVGPPCSAFISYWLEEDGEKLQQGSDNFYLESGEEVTEKISLVIPTHLEGAKPFYLEMQCNDSVILASRILEITTVFPVVPQFDYLRVGKSNEDSELEFSYSLRSNKEAKQVMQVEERVVKDGNVVWHRTQKVTVAGTASFNGFGPVLPPGSYQLVVNAVHGSESAEISRQFTVKAIPFPFFTWLMMGTLILLFAGAVVITTRFVLRSLPVKQAFLSVGRLVPSIAGPSIKRMCVVEAESSGVLDEIQLSKLFDQAGLKGKKRQRCFEVAGRIPLEQNVQSCVVTGKGSKILCETTVTATISNNTNRNWNNVELLVSIPDFLAEDLTSIKTENRVEFLKGKPVVKFLVEKIGAMQSAKISYSVDRLIAQAEANSIQLPAVINCKEGEPLVITQVKMEKPETSKMQSEEELKLKEKLLKKEENQKKP